MKISVGTLVSCVLTGIALIATMLWTYSARSQSVLEAPLSIQPKAGDSPTMQFDFTPGLDCKSLATKPAETLGMYRLCAQNKVVWVDFGVGYVKAFPALPLSKILIQCGAANVGRKGLLASSCSLIQQ